MTRSIKKVSSFIQTEVYSLNPNRYNKCNVCDLWIYGYQIPKRVGIRRDRLVPTYTTFKKCSDV